MAYATNQDVKDRFGVTLIAQLTTESSSTAPDEAVITTARQGAEAQINSYLSRRRYKVPIDVIKHAEVGALLKSYTLDLVHYRLRKDKGSVPEGVSKQYDEVVKWLMLVAEGGADLPAVDEEIEDSSVTGLTAKADGPVRLFSRDKTGGL